METREAEDAPEKRRSESDKPPSRRFKYSLAVIALVMVSVISVAGSAAPAEASNHRLAPSVFQCAYLNPPLYPGVQGQSGCVAAAQGYFAFAHYPTPIAVDGIFGPQTADHVRVFRVVNGLGDGDVVDATVWNRMVQRCFDADLRPPASVCQNQVRY